MSLQPQSQSLLLSLPLEVRLRIYEYLFTCQPQVFVSNLKPMLSYPKYLVEADLTSAILRTCRQIHNEASPILYSGNIFVLDYPKRTFEWLDRIGSVNLRSIRHLRVFVPHELFAFTRKWGKSIPERQLWYNLLGRLSQEATGLRYLYIFWDKEGGGDVRLVRELAKIQGLKRMEIDGYFAKHCPEYLVQKMGVPIQVTDHLLQATDYLKEYHEETKNCIP